ncbi:MAG: hypothetical protein M1824_001554 [Vezdaea acicularis]|nr:MAG: hypothetical protein M1824_001554 [Vezdaea acicularis]
MASPNPAPTATPSSLKLLSLDGGGIRGLSSLIILKHLMKRVRPQNPPKPCEYFDLIGGTSTGGLIAIMLGRLQMDVDTCINKYIELSSAAFQPKRVKGNFFGKAKDILKVEGTYSSDSLASEIRNIVKSQEGDAEAKLRNSNAPCKVFVCAFTKTLNTPVRLRTYSTDDAIDTLASSECTIWQAARATSAAAMFFDPIEIGRQKFVDGATGFNNPVEVVLEEAESIWPDARPRIQSLVSIGTGVPDLKDFGDNLKEVVETLKAISTETEETEKRFFKNHKDRGVGGRYFRYNVQQGLGGVGLDEHKIDKIEAATEYYLGVPQIKQTIDAFVAARAPNNLPPLDATSKDNHLKWLAYVDPLEYHNEARKNRTTESTGTWFLREEFEVWKKQPRSFLWLCGKAGCGKTVLSSTINDEIERQKLGVLAFFYFSFRRNERQDVRSLTYSLLIQLVRSLVREDSQEPGRYHLPRAFRDLYNKYQPARDPKIEDLNETFLGVLTESEETYIVVDALDECPLQEDRKEVVKFLAELSCRAGSNTHILITSRLEEDIESALSKSPSKICKVPIQKSRVNDDIRRHLQNCVPKDFQKWSPGLQKKVIETLTEKADGVFRWVGCQLGTLRRKKRERDVEKALNQLPRDLYETYSRMLSRIERIDYKDEAHAVLRWLAFSNRPLKLSEAAEAAIFDTSDPSQDAKDSSVSFDPKDRFQDPRDIRDILSGLVTVSGIDDQSHLEDEAISTADQDRAITFAHFSVKQYLMCDSVDSKFRLRESDGQWFILRSCLAYIHYYDTKASEESGLKPYPLLLYACNNWWHHAITSCCDKDQLTVLLAELHGTALTLSIRVALGHKEDPSDKVLSSALNDWLKGEGLFTELSFDFERSSALNLASEMGEEALVKLMLDAGANVNWRDGEKKTALHLAAEKGHEAVVRQLLEHDADVDAKAEGDWTALHIAAGNGHEAVMLLLLESGADIEMIDCGDGPPLAAAIDNGSEAVIKLLLAEGAKVNYLYWHIVSGTGPS